MIGMFDFIRIKSFILKVLEQKSLKNLLISAMAFQTNSGNERNAIGSKHSIIYK